jgi:phosphate butyryltransferase
MPITDFGQLIDVVQRGSTKRLAVAAAQSEEVLKAVSQAAELGIIDPILLGDAGRMAEIAGRIGVDLSTFRQTDVSDPIEAAARAVELVAGGQADLLMKGKMSTPDILRLVLEEKRGLRGDRLLSHVAVVKVESYPKLLIFSDGGMVIQPDLKQKIDIIRNAIMMANRLGIDRPKVALLASLETVHPGIPETLDAAEIVSMSRKKELPDAIIEGPLAMDIAVSSRAAEMKGISSEVSGDVDILIVPNIASGNIGVKGLVYLTGAQVGGLILGARRPIVLLSRSDTVQAKLNSIALGALCS